MAEEAIPEQPTIKEKADTTRYGVGAVSPDSRIFGVSVMAWNFLIVTLTVCACQLLSIGIYDHMVTLSLMLASFYAGAKMSK